MILPSRATLIGYGVLLLIALAALGFGGCEHHNAAAARGDRDRMEQQRDQARADTTAALDANKSNLETIAAQDRALNQWAAIGSTPEEIRAMVDDIKSKKEMLDDVLAQNRMLRAKDTTLPQCVALLRASLQRACPSTAAGMRKLAAPGRHEDGPGQRADAGAQGTAGGSH